MTEIANPVANCPAFSACTEALSVYLGPEVANGKCFDAKTIALVKSKSSCYMKTEEKCKLLLDRTMVNAVNELNKDLFKDKNCQEVN